MNWGALLAALAKLAEIIVGVFRERQARQDGATVETAKVQKETLDAVQVANAARVAAERDMSLRPDSVRAEDDGFRRD